jgi:hypothetical protein
MVGVCREEACLLWAESWEAGLLVSLLLLSLSLPYTALAGQAIINIDGNWR